MLKQLICLIKGHRPVKVVETWTSWSWSNRRRTFIQCERCGKEIKD